MRKYSALARDGGMGKAFVEAKNNTLRPWSGQGLEGKGRKRGSWVASKHGQTGKLDTKPGVSQQLSEEEKQGQRLCVQSLLSLD